MKYLFILGRNPELSIAEIFFYFKKNKIKTLGNWKKRNSLLVEIKDNLSEEIVNFLGGTISIGKVLCEIKEKELEKEMIYSGTNNKLNYCIWNFSENENFEALSFYLKKRFKKEKLKATQKNLTGEINFQNGKRIKIAKGKIDEEYFVFENYFGKIFFKSDYKEIEKRDMDKPERREELAISPRLAKIMINLSGAKENLLDPFCGIGVILFEALLQKLKVVGIDKDKNAILNAGKNLLWGNFNKKDYKLINADSKKIKISEVDCIVTEPDLGLILKKAVNKKQAEKQLKKFENLIIFVLNNLKNKVKGKIVFTAPYIKLVNKKRIGCDINKISQETRLKIIERFEEYRENQIVGREIFVLMKNDSKAF